MFLTNRFFGLFGTLAALFAMAYPFPVLLPAVQAAFVLALAIVATDCALLYTAAPRISAWRETNPVWSLGDPNPVSVHLQHQGNRMFHVQVYDELPDQFQERDEYAEFWLQPGENRLLQRELTPLSRGEYHFGDLNLFFATQLRLVQRRIRIPHEETIAVYPSIIQMKRYELRAMQHIAHETGIKKMRRIGHSYEFEQIKNYVQGDDYRSINWKASGRRGALMVNQYEDERSQQVYVIIDKSRVMKMPFNGLSLMDYAINTGLAISNIILKKQDKAGLLTFSNVIGATLKAERSSSRLNSIMDALYREKERPVEANYELLYQAVRRLISMRSLLLLFTNFESSYALERALPVLRRLNRAHLLVVIFFENTEIQRVAAEPVDRVADVFRQTIARQFLHDKKEMVYKLRQFGIQSILTRPEDLTLNTINKYLELKSRGLI